MTHDTIFLAASLSALTLAILWLGTRVNNLTERVSRIEGRLDIALKVEEIE